MLQLECVAKIYGHKVIFKEISCCVAPGSVTLVAGANGAGKSTLMRVMAGLSRPSAGRVIVSDDVRVGYLGHATFLYPGLTAVENLSFWNRAYGLSLSTGELGKVLARVGLEAYSQERVGCFSRGMAQRLNLARVLMQNPDLLLLDEPCSGLDTSSQTQLRQEIQAARHRGACVVLISHDLMADGPLADHLLVLARHRLSYSGPPQNYAGLTENMALSVSGVEGGASCCT
ncbi:MAG: ABC transporter ATP-binding protein [Desulfovibrio sp.]|nr:ABC transporter ATP-binding protein [Desulfovibrio sp.]